MTSPINMDGFQSVRSRMESESLMHGALSSMPNGQIPEDLAKQKDLDLVICGDQHGPKQSVEQSNLFNLETSKQRRLYYAMAPGDDHYQTSSGLCD